MGAPRKFDDETRARAVRMYQDHLRDQGGSKIGARKHVGGLLDIRPATLRNWVEAEERAVSGIARVGDEIVDVEEVKRLRRENAQLRRANEILKTASAFFAQAELDRRLT
jgi:transposase